MKRIESPSKKWAGYVILHDPLNLEQVLAWDAMKEDTVDLPSSKYWKSIKQKSNDEQLSGIDVPIWSSSEQKYILPALFVMVAEWHLENFPENPNLQNFPMTPRTAATALVNWLYVEIEKVYWGAVDVPNESSSTPTDTP